MKIFLAIFLTIFLKSNFVLASEFNWKKVVSSADGDSDYYLDSKSKRAIGNYSYQWILSNKLKDNDKIKSNIDYATIDCKRNKLQIILITDHSEFFGKGKIENHRLISENQLEWMTAEPGTIMSAIIKNSCNNIASSISSDDNQDRDVDVSKSKPKNKTKKRKYKEF
jgi:hypothetical protein